MMLRVGETYESNLDSAHGTMFGVYLLLREAPSMNGWFCLVLEADPNDEEDAPGVTRLVARSWLLERAKRVG